MDAASALRLAQGCGQPEAVCNALLLLAGLVRNDQATAAQCILVAPALIDAARELEQQDTLVRLFAGCSLHRLEWGKSDVTVATWLLQFLTREDATVKHFATLCLGNMSSSSGGARRVVAESNELRKILEKGPLQAQESNLLGLLANVSVDCASPEIAAAAIPLADSSPNAAFAYACCVLAKAASVDKELVAKMMRSPDQSIQESGLDIVACSAVPAIGPTPALCWMTEHVGPSVKAKARTQVLRFIEADLFGMIERGCIPVLWQLSLAGEEGFARSALNDLSRRISKPAQHHLLQRLRAEKDSLTRSHIATALAYVAPQVVAETHALSIVLEMLDEPSGRIPALDFFQVVHSKMVLSYEADADGAAPSEPDSANPLATDASAEEICNLLRSPEVDRRHRDEAFSLLLDRFDELFTGESIEAIRDSLKIVCQAALVSCD